MDAISGILCVAIVYLPIQAIFHGVFALPERPSMALSLGCAILIVALNWKRLGAMSGPAKRFSRPRTPPVGNRAARRKARDKAAPR